MVGLTLMLCLVQFVNGSPQRHIVARDMCQLRAAVSAPHAYHDVRKVLARVMDRPKEGRYALGDGYWLLVGQQRSPWARLMAWIKGRSAHPVESFQPGTRW
jgi:hypothetical protein